MSVHGPDGKRERRSPRLPGSGGGTSPLFSPDGCWLVTGTGARSGESALILWDLDESAPAIVAARGEVKALGFSSDGEHLAWIDDRGCSTLSLREPGLRRTAVSSGALLFDPAVYGLPEGSKLADVDAATTRRLEARSRSAQRSEGISGAMISGAVILPNGTAALGSEFRWARWRLLL